MFSKAQSLAKLVTRGAEKSLRTPIDVPKFSIMQISLHSVVLLVAVLFSITGCTRKQPPSPVDTVLGAGNGSLSEDLIPGNGLSDYGLGAEDLELRDGNVGIEDGYYNGRQMIVGKLENVYFDFDSAAIPSSERVKLQEAAAYLSKNPKDGLLIEGRSDWYGTADYNLALGDRRANSARDYLITLGTSPDRIEVLSKGSLEATSGLSKAQASQDRRANLIILK
jgi:peptidoglycan-associated lipoprotein